MMHQQQDSLEDMRLASVMVEDVLVSDRHQDMIGVVEPPQPFRQSERQFFSHGPSASTDEGDGGGGGSG